MTCQILQLQTFAPAKIVYDKPERSLYTIDERVTKLEENQAAQRWFLFGSGITGGAGLVKVLEAFF